MKRYIVFVLILVVLSLSGCAKEEIDDSKLNILTSFYPMYVATLNICDGIENVEVKNLTAPTTGCLHDYQITTSDMIKLSHADILVINGDGMENFIDKAISLYPNLSIVDASEGILENHEELLEHQEEHEEIHSEGHDHEHEANCHYWVSITLQIEKIKNIKNELIKINPENAEKYEKNAKDYIEELEKLKEKMHKELDGIENTKIVTFHEAFDFFAEEFGLEISAVIEREPGTYPSAKELANIIDLVKEKDITTIFIEPQYSRSAADTISRETKAKVYMLDPIVSGGMNKDAYINIMNQNLENLKQALK